MNSRVVSVRHSALGRGLPLRRAAVSVLAAGVPTLTAGGTGNGYTQNPYLFKGGIRDRASGLVKFGQRWYTPTTGTWTQQDTLDAPLDLTNGNRYAYAGDDPINNMDPTGLVIDWNSIAHNTVAEAAGGLAGAVIGVGLAPLCAGVVTCIGVGLAAAFGGQVIGTATANAIFGL